MSEGGDYWFIVGPCPDAKTSEEAGGQELKVKVGLHRQGDLLDTEEFPLPRLQPELEQRLLSGLAHVR